MARDTPLPAPTDQDALAAAVRAVALRQDRQAFALLFGHFAPRLKSYLLRLGTGPDAADDLLQEIMLSVWRRAGLYDPRQAAVSTWVFTIARNRRIDALRRAGRATFDPNDPAFAADPPAPADETVQSDQWRRRLEAAVRDLPPPQSEMLQLAYFGDQSHSDIAAKLKLPLGTVKSRLRLAIGTLRSKLKDRP